MAANPSATSRLALDEEARAIEQQLRMAAFREQLRFRTLWAARPLDLLRGLNDELPAILHFAGHGSAAQGLVLVDDAGADVMLSGAALGKLLAAFPPTIRLVVMNACYSDELGSQVVDVVGCVIGMNAPIGDGAARRFSEAFYGALGAGVSVRRAFDQAIAVYRIDSGGAAVDRDVAGQGAVAPGDVPVLRHRSDVDPDRITFAAPPPRRPSVLVLLGAATIAAIGGYAWYRTRPEFSTQSDARLDTQQEAPSPDAARIEATDAIDTVSGTLYIDDTKLATAGVVMLVGCPTAPRVPIDANHGGFVLRVPPECKSMVPPFTLVIRDGSGDHQVIAPTRDANVLHLSSTSSAKVVPHRVALCHVNRQYWVLNKRCRDPIRSDPPNADEQRRLLAEFPGCTDFVIETCGAE